MTDFETINIDVNTLRTQALMGYVRQEFDKESMLYAKYDVIEFAKTLQLPTAFISELLRDYNFELSLQFTKI